MTHIRTVTVLKVLHELRRVHGEWKTKFTVYTSYRAPLQSGLYETFDPFAAETCRQAEASGRSVVITSRTTAWGDEITGVELLDAQQAEGAA